ncbi:hypothetical protein SNEBB_001228 [Seison nebaliae]|nr:hypothetical protein SNEBB_001228 [Seison nebaliae]
MKLSHQFNRLMSQQSILSFFKEKNVKKEPIAVSSPKRMRIPTDEEIVDNVKENHKNEKEIKKEIMEEKKQPAKRFINFAQMGKKEELIDFFPKDKKFSIETHKKWKKDRVVPYRILALTLQQIEEESSRLEMIRILKNYFFSIISETEIGENDWMNDLIFSIMLCLNKVAADYENIELGIGEQIIMKSIAESTGRSLAALKTDFHSKGDLGLVAEESRKHQRSMFTSQSLSLKEVFNQFNSIAKLSGTSSQNQKKTIINELIRRSDPIECRFIVRSLTGKLRIGLAEQSVLLSLGQAILLSIWYEKSKLNEKSKRKFKDLQNGSSDSAKELLSNAGMCLKTAQCQCPNYRKIIEIALQHPLVERGSSLQYIVDECPLNLGIPLKPMLAQPTKGISEVLTRFEDCEFTCEYKYDGERAQIHVMDEKKIKIFSRNSEDNTEKYPDVIGILKERLFSDRMGSLVKNAIFDSEIVAFDRETQEILPFQQLTTRKRKNVRENEININVCIFVFDLLYFNDEPLIYRTLKERRQFIEKILKSSSEFGVLSRAIYKDLNNVEKIQHFLDQSIKDKCEGLMVKTLNDNATYEIAKRSRSWLKIKKDYLESGGDTLDLVIIGAYFGTGKRTSVYGGYLLACYDPESEEYQAICKLGTGFKDHDLTILTRLVNGIEKDEEILENGKMKLPDNYEKKRIYYRIGEGAPEPDVWFDPKYVCEVKCADLTLSPIYMAGIGVIDENRGISLRFPRYIHLRDDKKAEDATTSEMVGEMYKRQTNV